MHPLLRLAASILLSAGLSAGPSAGLSAGDGTPAPTGVAPRAAAAGAARADLGPPEGVLGAAALAERALHDRSAQVRARAALALRERADPQGAERLGAGLTSPIATVRHAALEALGTLADERSLALLAAHLGAARAAAADLARAPRSHLAVTRQVAYVADYEVEIAQAASAAKPVVGVVAEGSVLDVAIHGVGVGARGLRAELAATCRALARASGERHGADPDAWLAWWKARTAAAAATTTGDRASALSTGSAASALQPAPAPATAPSAKPAPRDR